MSGSSTYICNKCNSKYEGKPWITIQFPENTFKACSYLCYNHCRKFVLPKDHFDLIVNKEDFNHPRPITHKPDNSYDFKFLTETEINQLSNDDYRRYKEEFQDHHLLQPNQWEIYNDNLTDQARLRDLELDEYSDDEIFNDDY